MVVDVAYSTILAFFLCWWCWGLLLQRMSKPRLRNRQEAHLQMVRATRALGANASKLISDLYERLAVPSRGQSLQSGICF
jgi:hypothetical protein